MENVKEEQANMPKYEELISMIQDQQQVIDKFKINDFYHHLEWCWKVINSECSYITEEFKKEQAEVFMQLLTPKNNGKSSESR